MCLSLCLYLLFCLPEHLLFPVWSSPVKSSSTLGTLLLAHSAQFLCSLCGAASRGKAFNRFIAATLSLGNVTGFLGPGLEGIWISPHYTELKAVLVAPFLAWPPRLSSLGAYLSFSSGSLFPRLSSEHLFPTAGRYSLAPWSQLPALVWQEIIPSIPQSVMLHLNKPRLTLVLTWSAQQFTPHCQGKWLE